MQNPRAYFPKGGVEGVSGIDVWQVTSNICGLKEKKLENIRLKNIELRLNGGVTNYNRFVPEEADEYPEVFVYGWILPAKGIYFRHIQGLELENVTVETDCYDGREAFIFEDVER